MLSVGAGGKLPEKSEIRRYRDQRRPLEVLTTWWQLLSDCTGEPRLSATTPGSRAAHEIHGLRNHGRLVTILLRLFGSASSTFTSKVRFIRGFQ
jgi:hypothetical protein